MAQQNCKRIQTDVESIHRGVGSIRAGVEQIERTSGAARTASATDSAELVQAVTTPGGCTMECHEVKTTKGK
jgi:pyrroline-5-carboxylate reductase